MAQWRKSANRMNTQIAVGLLSSSLAAHACINMLNFHKHNCDTFYAHIWVCAPLWHSLAAWQPGNDNVAAGRLSSKYDYTI